MLQIAAVDQPHRVIGRVCAGALHEFIDRNHPRMLELARDPGLIDEASADAALARAMGRELLECDLAAEFIVAGYPDLPDAALGMQAQQRVAFASLWFVGGGRIAGGLIGILLVHGTSP